MTDIFKGLTRFKIGDKELYFVRYDKKAKQIVFWEHMKMEAGYNVEQLRFLYIDKVPCEALKELEIWDKLTNENRESHGALVDDRNKGIADKMEHVKKGKKGKKGRTKKFPHIPDELTCITCGKVQKVIRSVIAGRIEKKGILLDDYIKSYQCQVCNPTKGKGKKKNPKYDNLPEEMVCKCGFKTKVNPTQLEKRAERENVTMEKLIKNYKCQKCNPTKGRGKKK